MLHLFRTQRQEHLLVQHDLLAFLAEDEAQELPQRRRHRLVRRLVDVEENQPAQGVLCRGDVFISRGNGRFIVAGGDRQHFDRRIDVGQPGVPERVAIRGHAFCERKDGLLVLPESAEFDLAGARESLRQKIPGYMVPADFVVIETIPLTANGKIDFAALPAPSIRPMKDYAPPRTQLESTIAGIWQEELKIPRVGIDDNFFDLGGNSLTLVRVHSRLCADPEITVSVVDLFRYPTVRTLANSLNSNSRPRTVVSQAQERAVRQREAVAVRNATRTNHESGR